MFSLFKSQQDSSLRAEELIRRMEAGEEVVFLDVRTNEEFRGSSGRLKNAMLIPLHELMARIAQIDSLKKRTIVVYCRTGHRSAHATKYLRSQGFLALNLVGGIVEWNRLGLPVEREGG